MKRAVDFRLQGGSYKGGSGVGPGGLERRLVNEKALLQTPLFYNV